MVAKLTIDKVIGENDPFFEMMGIDSMCFSVSDMEAFLNANKDAESYEISVRSDGGCVRSGFEIYDLLKAAGKPIKTIGYRVNSIATVIFLAGDERELKKNAQFIAHNPWLDPMGIPAFKLTADEAQAIADEMRQAENKIKDFYAEKLQLDDAKKQELYSLMDKDVDMGADKALYFGFATSVTDGATSAGAMDKTASMIMALSLKNSANFKSKVDMDLKAQIDALKASNKSLLDKIKNFLKIKNEQATLADGTVVYWEGELQEGTPLFLDEAMETPAPDGNHTLPDGTVVTTAAGIVTSITAPDGENIEDLKAQISDLTAKLAAKETEAANLKAEMASLIPTISDLQNKVVELGAMVPNPVNPKASADIPVWKKRAQFHLEHNAKK